MLIVMRPHSGGGIGNYLFQLCHAILYAQLREASLVVPRPLAFKTLNRKALALDFSSSPASYDPDRIEVVGPFIHGNEATRLFSFKYRYHCMRDHIAPLFDPSADHYPVDENTLVIHVRSGDIFQEGGSNTKYAQPPLSWYETLIEGSGDRRIVLVSQSEFVNGGPNPVIAELEKRWPRVEVVSGDTEFDFHTLRNARHLALSVSTFAISAAMLNPHLRHLHVPLYERPEDPNLSGAFPSGIDLGFTRSDYTIGAYEMMRKWRNSPEQRSWMLCHPASKISSAHELPAKAEASDDTVR